MRFPAARLLQFAKRPRAGHVKTRLISAVGAQAACQLHQKLLRHTWQTLSSAQIAPLELWADSGEFSLCFDSLNPPAEKIHVQCGVNLGERMGNAVAEALKYSDAIVIVGSDCPVLDGAYVAEALQSLYDGADVVLGPASDGGYVLIGMQRYLPDVFNNVDWGSDQVLAQTRERLTSINCSWHELATLWDVDRSDDLERLNSLNIFDATISNG